MTESFQLVTVGRVRKAAGATRIEIAERYAPALAGLADFSHILVFTWLDRNDRPETRGTLQVHPRGNPANPLTGVFATRSPVRPNLIGLSACRILAVRGCLIAVDRIDVFDGTPVVDIKPCLGRGEAVADLKVPAWAERGDDP